MEGLEHDLLPRDDAAAGAFGIRLHHFDAAVERALREWEQHRGGRRQMTLVTAADRHRRPARAGLQDRCWTPRASTSGSRSTASVNDSDDGAPHEGFEMDQTLCLRGANFKVKWKLTEFEPNRPRHLGGPRPRRTPTPAPPTGSPTPTATGTHFEYENEFKAPGRVPRQGGVARDRGRRAPARGQPVAAALKAAARDADDAPVASPSMPHARYETDGDVGEIVLANPPLNLFDATLIDGPRAPPSTRPPTARAARADLARRGRRVHRRRRRARVRGPRHPAAPTR